MADHSLGQDEQCGVDSVLVIDDDPVFCQIVQTCALNSGVGRVKAAHNAHSALQLLWHGARFDLMLLDLVLPDIDGVAVLRELKELDYSGTIVIVSGNAPFMVGITENLGKSYGLDILDAVKKPVRKDDIRRWIGEASASDGTRC